MMHSFSQFQQNSEETRTEIFEFNPDHLMCMKNCGTKITSAMGELGISQDNIGFNINEHLMQVTVPASMSNQTIIDKMTSIGREAWQYTAPDAGIGKGAGNKYKY